MAIKGYANFDWQVPKVVVSLLKGKDAEKLYKEVKEDENSFEKSSMGFLDYNSNEIRGSNPLRAGQIYRLIGGSKVRVAVPGDDFKGGISNLIKSKYYTDFNVLVAHKDKPIYEKNNGLWKKVIELAQGKKGNLIFPFMVQGFYVLPDKKETGYEVKIVPASNFEVIVDDRLSGKYNEWNFDKVDEKGLPINLDKSKGNRTFYTRNDGLSGVCLGGYSVWDSGLNSGGGDLTYSDGYGRVVVVYDTEGVAPKNFEVGKSD